MSLIFGTLQTIAIAKGEVPVSPPDKVSNGPTGYVSFSPFMAPDGAKGDEGKPTAVTNVGSDGSSGSKTGSGGRAHSHDHGRTAHSHSHSHDHGGTTQSHGAGLRMSLTCKACLLAKIDGSSSPIDLVKSWCLSLCTLSPYLGWGTSSIQIMYTPRAKTASNDALPYPCRFAA